MATLEDLVTQKLLVPIAVELGPREFYDRKMYGSPAFKKWLFDDVMRAKAFYSDSISPKQQAYSLIKHFISGKPMRGTRLFQRMSPSGDDVWEFRSAPDLRFFGWFPKKDAYIAVKGDFFETLKADKTLYDQHRLDVIQFRKQIDLNEPKYVPGAGENDVVSE